MFGSIGHAARDAKSLSQRSSGHINEVQPDEGVVSVVRTGKGFTLGWDVPPSQSQFCEGSSALRQGKDQPNSCGLHLNVKVRPLQCIVTITIITIQRVFTSAHAAYKMGAAWPLERMNRSLAACFGSDTE